MSSGKPGMFGRLFGRGVPKDAPEATPEHEDAAADEAVETTGAPAPESAPNEAPAAEVAPAPETAPEAETEPAPESDPEPEPVSEPRPEKKGWFARLKDGMSRSSSALNQSITGIFTKRKLDDETLEELEDVLIQADLGLDMAVRITEAIAKEKFDKQVEPDEIREVLAREVTQVLEPVARPLIIEGGKPFVILMAGVNGAGKTTTIGKLAAKFRNEGRKVMLAAGDTFRAAAIDQLKIWGERTGAPVVSRAVGADASGLAYDAWHEAHQQGMDVLMLDTAGRLQNRTELMAELEKIVRVLKKCDPAAPHAVLLVLDATTGQNALSQVEIFRKVAGVTGLIVTKLDGTARGGILVAISEKYGLPVHAIGVGEGVEDLQPFKAADYAKAIAGAG